MSSAYRVRAMHNLDPVKRVARMSDVSLVLFVPFVKGAEVENHIVLERRVGRPKRGRATFGVSGGNVERLAIRGVHAEWHTRVIDRSIAQVRSVGVVQSFSADSSNSTDPEAGSSMPASCSTEPP